MSEEDKAIEKIKRQIIVGKCEKNIGIPVYISDLETLLTAYEKEKEKNKELNWKYTASWVDEHFVSKDKIKAKIEELQEDIQYSANPLSIDNSKFGIKVLQSLLEKE